MRLTPLVLILLAMALSVGCAQKPVVVEYNANASAPADLYPLPSDAPSVVTLQSKQQLSRLELQLDPIEQGQSAPLLVRQLEDSLGNLSLSINRTAGQSWELVDQALTEMGTRTIDRDRREYQFVLGPEVGQKRGLLTFLSPRSDLLTLVLVPQGQETLVSLEASDNQMPERDVVENVLLPLQETLTAQ